MATAVSQASPPGLSPGETQGATCLARGEANEGIATRLGGRSRTVAKRVACVDRKLGVERRTAAAAGAFEVWSVAEARTQ